MTTSASAFVDETFTFFSNTNLMLRDVMPVRSTAADKLRQLLNDSFELLFGTFQNEIRNEFLDALRFYQEETRTYERRDALDLLFLELNYFNTRYDYVNAGGSTTIQVALTEMKSKEKIDVADITLDSVDKLIKKLPKVLRDIIQVIREILGITKAVIGG